MPRHKDRSVQASSSRRRSTRMEVARRNTSSARCFAKDAPRRRLVERGSGYFRTHATGGHPRPGSAAAGSPSAGVRPGRPPATNAPRPGLSAHGENNARSGGFNSVRGRVLPSSGKEHIHHVLRAVKARREKKALAARRVEVSSSGPTECDLGDSRHPRSTAARKVFSTRKVTLRARNRPGAKRTPAGRTGRRWEGCAGNGANSARGPTAGSDAARQPAGTNGKASQA